MLRISYELNSALIYRRKTRTFGNIDTDIRELGASEILANELDKMLPKMRGLFDIDSSFYAHFDK